MACTDRQPGWYKDPEQLREEYEAHGTFVAIAVKHGGSESSYSKWWLRHGLSKHENGRRPNNSPTNEEVTLDADRLDDIHSLLRSRGLNPEEWVVVRVILNAWEGFYKTLESNGDGDLESTHEVVPQKQLKVTLRPRLETLIAPARDVKPIASPKKPDKSKPRLVVFVGDEQAPYHDEKLHDFVPSVACPQQSPA